MKKKIELIEEYKIFHPDSRGSDGADEKIGQIMAEKETSESLSTLASGLSDDWNATERNVTRLTLAFSNFEKKFEARKKEMLSAHSAEEIEKVGDGSGYLFSDPVVKA